MQTITKTSEKPANNIVSAISLGVFLRDAPSTRAIILSRKLSPGSVVTITRMLSDNTFVPPVTELLSPTRFTNYRGTFAGYGTLID